MRIGIIGRGPSSDELSSALSSHSAYVYCGHGGGSKFVAFSSLLSFDRVTAAVLLFGCSSIGFRGERAESLLWDCLNIPAAYLIADWYSIRL